MRPVVLDTFPLWSEHYEGRTLFFYLDVKRLVTIGIGDLVDPLPSGLLFALDGEPCSESDVKNAWSTVKNDRTLDPRKGGSQYARLTSIRMTEEGVQGIVRTKMLQMEITLKKYLTDWEDAPAAAQRAAMSHSWAFGPEFPSKWPSWTRCFNAGDYAGASLQDVPSAAEMSVQNASFHARIAEEQRLLANASQWDPDYLP